MKKITALLGSAALAATLFTGCGEEATTETPVTQTDTGVSKAVALRSLDKTTKMLQRTQAKSNAEIALADVLVTLADSAKTGKAQTAVLNAKNYISARLQGADKEEFDAMTPEEQELLIATAVLETTVENAAPQQRSLLDSLKDGIVDLVGTDVGTDLSVSAFKVVLESDGVTNAMLDLAIGSQTITDVMITVMQDQEGWNSLTPKMAALMRDPNNIAFTEKFMELCDTREDMARFVFTYIDAPMYDALADAMIISSDAHLAGGDASSSEHDTEYTTATLGKLMAKYAADYFIIPTTSDVAQGEAARFSSLMFNSGTEVRGDGNELINEKFFYALFKTPGSTESFVEAMKAIDPADKETYMDLFFLGNNPIEDAAASTDVNQSYNNIIAIAGGMYQGTNDYTLGAYTDSFLGFAGIVPTDKYWTYGKSFMMAGYAWGEMNGYSIFGTAYDYVSEWISEDDNATVAAAPTRRGFIYEVDDRNSTNWTSFAYDTVSNELFDRFDWDTAIALGGAAYDYFFGDENSTVADDTYAALENNLTEASNNIQEAFRAELEAELNEDITGFNADTDANPNGVVLDELALPAFSDMNVSYVYTAVSDRTMAYVYGIDAKWVADFSENSYIQEYVYGAFTDENGTVTWDYIPNWMTQLDWLKLPEIYASSNYDDWGFDFETGSFDIYIITELEDAQARLLSDTGLTWTPASEGDTPLSSDLDANYYVYKTTVNLYDLVDFNLNDTLDSISDYANGVAVDVGLVDAPAAETNTTTEG